ncbi:MAG TPA: hypothetical protein PKD76_04650 [Solirubrobacterales bacterium]|nr:hypothetical protein [Solirubrobacterales bacterium]
MGYRVATEKEAPKVKRGGIPTMYLIQARLRLAGKAQDRGCVIDRAHYARELDLPINHEDVYRAAYADAGLLEEFLAEAERLRRLKVGTKFHKP